MDLVLLSILLRVPVLMLMCYHIVKQFYEIAEGRKHFYPVVQAMLVAVHFFPVVIGHMLWINIPLTVLWLVLFFSHVLDPDYSWREDKYLSWLQN